MTDSSLSFVNLSSLNAGRSFWDQIFEVRSYIDTNFSDIWTENRRKQICGQLDSNAMKNVLDELREKGKNILTAETSTGPLKLLIDAEDESGLAKILMALKYPNEVFNTAGNYESYMNDYSSYSSSSYEEFANNIQNNSKDKFIDLNSTVVTTIIAEYPGTSGGVQYKLLDVLIPKTGWESQSNGDYTQSISVADILETDVPIIDIVLSDTAEIAKQEQKDWNKIRSIETQNSSLLVRCLESKPTIDLNIKLQLIRGA